MLKVTRTIAARLIAIALATQPASAQAPAIKSATPQQKDAWGEDMVRYCAAEIQAAVRANSVGNEARNIADHLASVVNDDWGAPESLSSLEVHILNAANQRASYEEARKDPKLAKLLPSLRDEVAKYDARACIASRAIQLISGAREIVTVWNRSPDTIDVWLNNTLAACTLAPGRSCDVSVPTGAAANVIGSVGGAVRYGPFSFDPVGDGARTFILDPVSR